MNRHNGGRPAGGRVVASDGGGDRRVSSPCHQRFHYWIFSRRSCLVWIGFYWVSLVFVVRATAAERVWQVFRGGGGGKTLSATLRPAIVQVNSQPWRFSLRRRSCFDVTRWRSIERVRPPTIHPFLFRVLSVLFWFYPFSISFHQNRFRIRLYKAGIG